MSYMKEFEAACNRSRQWKIGDYSLPESGDGVEQAVLNELEATQHIPFAERAAKGMSVNFGAFHMLLKKFNVEDAVITMGNVAVNGEMRLPVTASHLKKVIKHQSGEENMDQYHLWTTLPDGMILDSVILSSLSADGLVSVDEMIPAERFLYANGDALPHGLTYHPIVVGLEFFVASGTIDPEAMNYLMGDKFPKQYA